MADIDIEARTRVSVPDDWSDLDRRAVDTIRVLAAAIAPPRRVANTRPTGGIPRWARNIAGTVTTSSCSMMRVFVRPR